MEDLNQLMERLNAMPPMDQARVLIAIVSLVFILAIWAYILREKMLAKYKDVMKHLTPRHPYFKDKYNGR